jgi:hypothetical protein
MLKKMKIYYAAKGVEFALGNAASAFFVLQSEEGKE